MGTDFSTAFPELMERAWGLHSALVSIAMIVLFTGLSVLIITLFLGVVFRRFVGIVIPLSVAFLSLLATVSVMGALGTLSRPTMPSRPCTCASMRAEWIAQPI